MNGSPTPRAWWGEFELPVGATGHWRIGAADVWIRRSLHEWRVAHEVCADLNRNAVLVDLPLTDEPAGPPPPHLLSRGINDTLELQALHWRAPPQGMKETSRILRFSFGESRGLVTLSPMLADRHVVVRLEVPFYVAPGESVTIYVSTAIWLAIAAGKPPRKLTDFALVRPSDTWFGPNTREGEICYSSRSFGRVNLRDLTILPHRALTPVRVQNRGGRTMFIERLNIPVPALSLFHGADGSLWTEAIGMESEQDGGFAVVKYSRGPATEAGNANLVQNPREPPESNIVARAFSALFG